jgi:hypothetical protein
MRPVNLTARLALDSLLKRSTLPSAKFLSENLGISLPTMHRILASRHDDVLRLGTTKSSRYALKRPIRGELKTLPIYQVNEQGKGMQCGLLETVYPQGTIFHLDNTAWPRDEQHANEYWDGLPYPMYDMRPQGYLGRNFALRASSDLNVSDDPEEWGDDDITYVLSRRGSDTSGNLIIGDDAYRLWLETVMRPESALMEDEQATEYARMATEVTSLVGGGSSAGGEFPKFTAKRLLADRITPHVIVKFSGADASTPVQRWSDLLVCEHLALLALSQHSQLSTAFSRILSSSGRTFLEVERFDRIGEHGRTPMLSLFSLDAAFIGMGKADWPIIADKLLKLGFISASVQREIEVLWWFGKLIGNTDMHLGNLSFTFDWDAKQFESLALSPAYDMLPMMYSPLSGGEIPERQFIPQLPLPREADSWNEAHKVAQEFWLMASVDERISRSFRAICLENFKNINRL